MDYKKAWEELRESLYGEIKEKIDQIERYERGLVEERAYHSILLGILKEVERIENEGEDV